MQRIINVFLDADEKIYRASMNVSVNAETVEQSAAESAAKAEAYAKGTVNGVAVAEGETGYHDNAKYYKDLAGDSQSAAATASAQATLAKTAAETARDNAQSYAGQASASQTAAGNSQTAANASAQNAEAWAVGTRNGEPVPPTDPAYHNNAKFHAENTDVHQDGNYPEMTVGTAEQLESTVMTEDKAPYVFRTSGGSADIGNREYDTLVGGTVAWNQLSPDANVKTLENWTVTADDIVAASENTIVGHVYLLSDVVTEYNPAFEFAYRYFYNDTYHSKSGPTGTHIYKATVSAAIFKVNFVSSYAGRTITKMSFNPQAFDLTLMFGSTIADYIYSLETATPGAGVAYFRKLFPKSYYPYNAGTLIHVNASAHKTVGFNQWDEEIRTDGYYTNNGTWQAANNVMSAKNFIPVIPNTDYYVAYLGSDSSVRIAVTYWDANQNFIFRASNVSEFTTPSNCYFILFNTNTAYGTTYKNDICINLSWSGTRNGEYEPYDAHTYPLDSDLVLRGIPKLDASNKLYYDGDSYEADGTVTRRYGIIDMGDINWTLDDAENHIFMFLGYGIKYSGLTVSTMYSNTQNVGYLAWLTWDDLTVGITNNATSPIIRVKNNAYSDATAFKTAMSGVYIVYELATPTTESADPFASPQIVNDWGTEEYVVTEQSGVAMPVGHNTKYPQNLRDKLQHLPNLAGADGYYGIQQTGTQMVLVEPDNALSDTSKNAVQNKVVKAALDLKADKTDVATADAALTQMILASFPTDTIENAAIASFTDGADNIPVKALTVNITPVQTGSGDPSPDNVRPISGWTGANIARTGKNLLDSAAVVEGAIDENGDVVSSTTTKISPLIRVKPNTDYVLSGISGTAVRWKYFRSDGSFVGQSETLGLTMTTPAECAALRLQAANNTWGAVANWQFEEGATATSYEAFGTTYAVSWQSEAGTVYAGTLTWLGGDQWKLTVTGMAVDLGTFGWGKSSTYTNGFVATSQMPTWWNISPGDGTTIDAISDTYIPVSYNTWQGSPSGTMAYRARLSGKGLCIKDDTLASYYEDFDADGFAAAVSGKKVVKTLVTPVEYTLTIPNSEIKTILGANNIFADCGDIASLTYRADPTLYSKSTIEDAIGGSY